MSGKRPIDALRDSAKSGRIGSDGDDSAISDMIPIGYTLYIIKERAIYGVRNRSAFRYVMLKSSTTNT